MTLNCRVEASGDLGTLSRFIYDIEKDPMALKLESVELSARDTTGQQLTLNLQISGLVLVSQSQTTMNPTRHNSNGLAGESGRPARVAVAVRLGGARCAEWPGGRARRRPTPPPQNHDYSSFQIIADRNIFDPNRYPHTTRSRGRSISPSAPGFSLVGTMSYRKGMLAFFDGNESDYRKVLSLNGTIAGYKVVEITLHGVKLASTNKPVEMKVGAQMRQEGKGEWQLAGSGELPASHGRN